MSDNAKLKNVAHMFAVGASVKCRVICNETIDGKRQLLVTHKKSLMESALPPLLSYEDAQVGSAHHGILVSVKQSGCLVKFFNDVKAFVPRAHLSALEDITNPEEFFHMGQTVKAFIISVDAQAKRMLASLKPGAVNEMGSGASAQLASLTVGTLITVTVAEHNEQGQITMIISNNVI